METKRKHELKITGWLGKQDFTDVSNSSQPRLVLFAAHWCGYCSSFLSIARKFKAPNDTELVLVDADDPDESLWDDFKLKLVPTLAVFRSGKQLYRKDGIPGIGLQSTDLEEAVKLTEDAAK